MKSRLSHMASESSKTVVSHPLEIVVPTTLAGAVLLHATLLDRY